MSLAEYYTKLAGIKKHEPKQKADRKLDRDANDRTAKIRAYVMGRERNICRICRFRVAESMHELKPKSLRGKVSRANSIGTCGDGVRGCHGFAQRNEIRYRFEHDGVGADATIVFQVHSEAAADWVRVPRGLEIVSPPMQTCEIDGLT